MTPNPPFVRNDEEYLALTQERQTVPFRTSGQVFAVPTITRAEIVRTERGPGVWVDRNRLTGEVVARSGT